MAGKKFAIITLAIGFLFAFSGAVEASEQVTGVKIQKRTRSKVYMQWNEVQDASKYLVRVVTKKNKNLKVKKTIKNNKTVVKGLQANKRYKIRIKAKVNGEYGAYCDGEEVKTKKGPIYLTGEDENTTVNWESKIDAENGYKLVWSKNSKPEYPTRSGDKYAYYSDPDTDEGEIDAFKGSGTYHVRVCEYLGGKCGTYSNQIKVDLTDASDDSNDNDEESGVESITLSTYSGSSSLSNALPYTNDYNVQWSVDGYSSSGFKLVWSKNANPTYPTRDGDKYAYYSSPSQTKGTTTAFDGSGTYYVRVCEYLGGKCGTYSNQIEMNL